MKSNKGNSERVLFIVRHAKSSWEDPSLSDLERPLKKRGDKDAHIIGGVLSSRDVLPDIILSSPAERAIATAIILAKEMNYPKKKIVKNEVIYEASSSELLEIIEQLNDSLKSVMLVGHNPSFTSLVNYLTDTSLGNLPTCGVMAIRFDGLWEEVERESGAIIYYEYPKKYKEK